LTDFIGRTMR